MDRHLLECLFSLKLKYAYFVPVGIRVRKDLSVINIYARVQFIYIILFHFVGVEKGNDPETAEATMEGLAFPSPPSRAAGSEEAGRTLLEGNPWQGFPSNGRFAPCLPSKEHLPMNSCGDIEICSGIETRAGQETPPRDHGGLGNGVKNPDGELGRLRIVSRTIFPTGNGRGRVS